MNPNFPLKQSSLSHTERLDCSFSPTQLELNSELFSINHSLEWYQNLYNNSPILYFTLSLDGIILDLNQTAIKALELDIQHILGRPIFQFIDQPDIATLNAVLQQLPGQTKNCECRLLNQHNQEVWVKASLQWQSDKVQTINPESFFSFCQINSLPSFKDAQPIHPTILLACENITETKKLENNLNEERLFSAEFLHSTDQLLCDFASTLIDASLHPHADIEHPLIFGLDQSQNIIYANVADLKIPGKSLEEIQALSFKDLFLKPLTYNQSFASSCQTKLRKTSSLNSSKTSAQLETHILTLEGNCRHIFVSNNKAWTDSIVQLSNTQHILNYKMCIGVDLTQKCQPQKALEASETRYRQLFDKSFDAIVICDQSQIIQANSSFLKLAGVINQETLLHTSIFQLIPSLASLQNPELNTDHEAETIIQALDGTQASIKLIATSITWNQKSALQIIIRKLDTHSKENQPRLSRVKEFQHSDQKLQQSHQQISNILESIADAFFAVDQDFKFTYINREAEILLQRNQAELIGRQIWQEFPEAIRSTFFQKYEDAIRQQIPIVFEEFYPSLNRWFSIHAYPTNTGGLSVYFNDISERKTTELLKQQQTEREWIIAKIQTRIHQSLNLEEILNITVAEVRQFLETDRVLIYRLQPNCRGLIEVESVQKPWTSVRGMVFYDPCFAQNYSHLYQQGRIRAIDNINCASLQTCHIELLEQLQVKASLIVPIFQNNSLWGLLIAHHCRAPRHWQQLEMELLQSLATQVGIAIDQSQLYQQVQQLNSQLETKINERTRELKESLNFAAVLKRITDRVRESLDEHQILQTAVQEVAGVLNIDYCASILYNGERTTATVSYEATHPEIGSALGQIMAMGEAPKVYAKLLKGEYFAAYESGRYQFFQASELGDLACPDLAKLMVSRLLCPIFDDQGAIGHLTVLHQTYRIFSTSEIHLVQQVAAQCAIALRQARLYQESQAQVKQLQKLSRLKDEFLSTVSHELRTPMSNMKLAIQMLKIAAGNGFVPACGTTELTQNFNSQKATRYLKILQDECEREISLINDLLDLQRLDAGVRSFQVESLDLKAWIDQIILPFQDRTSSRQQSLKVQCPQDLPLFIGDSASLERVLTELLNNACKYTPPHESITIKVGIVNEMIQFKISNTGVEIPPEELPHIFEKFYRVPSADPWKQGGTGLGLALVQKLIDHLEGMIKVDSQQGQTCFTVELPLTVHASSKSG